MDISNISFNKVIKYLNEYIKLLNKKTYKFSYATLHNNITYYDLKLLYLKNDIKELQFNEQKFLKINFKNFCFKNGSLDINKKNIIINFKTLFVAKNTIIKIEDYIIIKNKNIIHIIFFNIILYTNNDSKLINDNYLCKFKYICHKIRHVQLIINFYNKEYKKLFYINEINNYILLQNNILNLSMFILYISNNISNIIYYNNKLYFMNDKQIGGNEIINENLIKLLDNNIFNINDDNIFNMMNLGREYNNNLQNIISCLQDILINNNNLNNNIGNIMFNNCYEQNVSNI